MTFAEHEAHKHLCPQGTQAYVACTELQATQFPPSDSNLWETGAWNCIVSVYWCGSWMDWVGIIGALRSATPW